MAEKRDFKKDDQEIAITACDILFSIIGNHPQIEGTLWTAAMLRIIAMAHHASHVSHEEYKNEMMSAVECYKSFWEENE